MSFKKTLIFTVLLAAVAAFIFFFEIPHAKKKAEKNQADKKILDLDFDKIDMIELVRPDDTVRLVKEGEDWHIESPIKDLADRYQVTSIINAVRFGVVSKKLTDLQTPLKNYGLEKPKMKVTFRAGGITKTLEIGKPYRINGSLFVKQAASPDVLIVPDSLMASMKKTPTEIRESKVFRGDHGPVVRLKMETRDKTIDLVRVKKEFLKEGEEDQWEWKFESPIKGYADEQHIDELISKAQDLITTDFIQENRDGDQLFGLDRPLLRLTLGYASEQKDEQGEKAEESETTKIDETTLLVGNQKPNQEQVFAALDGANFVITLHKDTIDPFLTDAASLKDRHVVRFAPQNVAKINLQIADSSSSISHSGSEWTFEDGTQAAGSALEQIIKGFEKMQGTLTAEGKKAKPKKFGITKKSDSIAFLDKDGQVLVRILRGSQNMKLGSVILADAAEKSLRIYTLAKEELVFWPASIESLKAPEQTPEPEETAKDDTTQ